MLKILIIDDERIFRMRIKSHLKDHHVIEADSFNSALKCISEHSFDICFIDLNLDKSDTELLGLEVLKCAIDQGFYNVIMSSITDSKIIEHAFEIGCNDYYNKGSEEQSVSEVINRFLLNKENYLEKHFLNDKFLTKSLSQANQLKKIIPIIKTDLPILLLGESGTGKSYLAKEIHNKSGRIGQFVEVNCSSFNEELLESELFGHTKGAFTGATADSKGKLALAHQGTLFLDELGSMSLPMQAKLLKAIEEKSFYPINSDKLVKSDFRVISATLDDLEKLIKNGSFRFDLYQRICGINIELLPLKNRTEDLNDLINIELINMTSMGRRFILSKDAREVLLKYSWPGNMREFKRLFQILAAEGISHIRVDQIEKYLSENKRESILDERHFKLAREVGLSMFIEMVEQEVVQHFLKKNTNGIRKTMHDLKINQAKVYKYIDEKNI